MNKGKYVFSQLLDFLDRSDFNYLVMKYGGERYVKNFTCYKQLAVLMYGQLSNRESLCDVVIATQASVGKGYHPGFEKCFQGHLGRCQQQALLSDLRGVCMPGRCGISEAQSDRHIQAWRQRICDTTTLEHCLGFFKWVIFRKNQRKGGIRLHTLYHLETSVSTFFHITEARMNDKKAMDAISDEKNTHYIFDCGYNDFRRLFRINAGKAYFIVRGKKNIDFKTMKWIRRFLSGSGIMSDAIGYMNREQTRFKYLEKIRRIIYWDEVQWRKFIFFNNQLLAD